MPTEADQYRAFARECIKWSRSAETVERREVLLDMATHWVEAAARLDYRQPHNDFATRAREARKGTNSGDQRRRELDYDERGDASGE
jgi:hypothetical protein